MFVCLYGTYTNPHFWTDLNQTSQTSPPWSGGGRRVCMDSKFLTSSTFWALFLYGPLQNHGRKMAAGATVFRDTLISVNSEACSCDVIREVPCTPATLFRGSVSSIAPARVRVTSRTRRSGTQQLRILIALFLHCVWCIENAEKTTRTHVNVETWWHWGDL
jgi:hypothetical protein